MKLTLKELVMSTEAFTVLSRTSLVAAAAFRVAEFMTHAEAKLAIFREQRKKIMDKHNGELNGPVMVQFKNQKDREAFDAEVEELMAVEVELPDLSLKVSDLAPGSTVEPRYIAALGWAFGISAEEEKQTKGGQKKAAGKKSKPN